MAETKWVFGYGSLCWLPGFDFDESVAGHVKGFARRFWQGNSTHRGTTGKVSQHYRVVQPNFTPEIEVFYMLILV